MKKDKAADPEALSGGSEGREPQSYGSESDWLTGRTDQTVNRTPERASRHDEEFYENRHDQSGEVTEGRTPAPDAESVASPEQMEEGASATTKVDETTGGRDSYFKNRDYRND